MSKFNFKYSIFCANAFKKNNNIDEYIKSLQNDLYVWNLKAKKIKSKFKFDLPEYIIDEIIENENKKDYTNLHCLINAAVINGTLSTINGNLIKKIYN